MRDPETPKEWQEAVDACEALLLLESARMYGLVDGGPVVDVERCESLVRRAQTRMIWPRRENVMAMLLAMIDPDVEEEERRCRDCGCTDYDCSECVERTGEACHWVDDDLCSACAEVELAEHQEGDRDRPEDEL